MFRRCGIMHLEQHITLETGGGHRRLGWGPTREEGREGATRREAGRSGVKTGGRTLGQDRPRGQRRKAQATDRQIGHCRGRVETIDEDPGSLRVIGERSLRQLHHLTRKPDKTRGYGVERVGIKMEYKWTLPAICGHSEGEGTAE